MTDVKLTTAQFKVLRNIRDHGFHAATGFHGASERGGAVKSVDALRRRGLVDGPHRSEHLTDEGKRVLKQAEDEKIAQRNAGMTNAVRRVLREAGFTEARGDSTWGYQATPGTVRGVMHVQWVRDPSPLKREGSKRFGNVEISRAVRTLQSNGFTTSRVNGVTEVDKLIIMYKGRN